MTYHVLEIKADGRVIRTIQAKAPTYEQQKKAVGGFIETVPYFTKMSHEGFEYKRGTAYCNEEGRLFGLPFNATATQYWIQSCPQGDPAMMMLYGDVIFHAKVKP